MYIYIYIYIHKHIHQYRCDILILPGTELLHNKLGFLLIDLFYPDIAVVLLYPKQFPLACTTNVWKEP